MVFVSGFKFLDGLKISDFEHYQHIQKHLIRFLKIYITQITTYDFHPLEITLPPLLRARAEVESRVLNTRYRYRNEFLLEQRANNPKFLKVSTKGISDVFLLVALLEDQGLMGLFLLLSRSCRSAPLHRKFYFIKSHLVCTT